MSTSLARQLALLRTPGSLAAAQDTAYSGPFLFKEADQDHCDPTTLKENVSEALQKLIELDIVFARYTSFLLDERNDTDNVSETLEDLLLLLSPFILQKPAQWLLQYLVITHKVHYKHAEIFFFCVLPFYDYDIYAKSVAAIETSAGGAKYPNWFPKFKQACFPTTKLALFRHTAVDRGFFKLLCDLMRRLERHQGRFPNASLQRQVAFFVTTILGGLEHCGGGDVGEEQAMHLLPVLLAALKANGQDLVASGQILLSYLLSRALFKAKTVSKILKAVRRLGKKEPACQETLMLAVLLVRTQLANLERRKGLALLVSLEPAVNSLLNEAKSRETDVTELADNLLFTLSPLVYQGDVVGDDVELLSQEDVNGMGMMHAIMKAVTPLSDATVYFVTELANRLAKALEGHPGEMAAELFKLATKILSAVERSYPKEYQKVCAAAAAATGKPDVFFLGGSSEVSGQPPDEAVMKAKRALMDSPLLRFLSDRPLGQLAFLKNNKKMALIMKEYQPDLVAVLAVSTDFLLGQMAAVGQLETLLVNLVRLVPLMEAQLLPQLLHHVCSPQLLPQLQHRRRLELLLLPLFVQTAESASTLQIIAASQLAQSSGLLAPLLSLSPDHPHRFAALMAKCRLGLSATPQFLTELVHDEVIVNHPELVSLLLAAMLAAPVAASEIGPVMELCVHTMLHLPVSEMFEDLADAQNHVSMAKLSGTVSARLVFDTLQHLKLSPDSHLAEIQQLVTVLPTLYQTNKADLAISCYIHIRQMAGGDGLSLLRLMLRLFGRPGIDDRTRLFCMAKSLTRITKDPSAAAQILLTTAGGPLFPILVRQTLHAESRIQKVAFAMLRKMAEIKLTGESETLRPLLDMLVENRAELLSQAEENLAAVLERSPPGEAALLQLLQLTLSDDSCASCQLLEQLMPLFVPLRSCGAALDRMASFCLSAMKLGGEDIGGCLCAFIDHFGSVLPGFLFMENCYAFFLRCLVGSPVRVTVSGIDRLLADYLAERCSHRKQWKKVPVDIVRRLLADAVEHCHVFPLGGRNTLCSMKPTAAMFLTCLAAVWPAGILEGTVQSSEKKAVKEDPSWTKSIFLLELMEMVLKLPSSPAAEETRWADLIAPLFILLRRIPDAELEESSYKLNLLFTVLLHLFGRTSDTQLRSMNSRDLDPELLTHCIRACPSPDTRQLALRVLAKCAVTSPDFVLHNSMAIFTFMGSHLLRVDSRHSYQVACQAIDVIVPAIKAASQVVGGGGGITATSAAATACQGILTTFMDAGLDVPEHRYTEFLDRLVRALDTDSYLWMALLLAVKVDLKPTAKGRRQNAATVTSGSSKQSAAELTQRRMVELVCRYPAATALGALLRVVVNIRTDAPPLRKMFGLRLDRREDGPDDWDLLRLSGLVLVTRILSTFSFKEHVGQAIEEEEVGQILNLLLESAILAVEAFNRPDEPIPDKLRKSLVYQAEKVLESCLSLLPTSIFLSCVGSLLASTNPNLRKRALEVVSAKLGQDGQLSPAALADLLPQLVNMALTEEQPTNQMTALLAVRQVAKLLPDIGPLKAALTSLSPAFLAAISNPGVLGAAVLAVSDVLACAEVQGVPFVGPIVCWLRDSLDTLTRSEEKWGEKDLSILYSSMLISIQKVAESFPGFINPQLSLLIVLGCRLSTHHIAAQRAKGFLSSLADTVQPHILLPQARHLLDTLWEEPHSVAALVNLIAVNSRKLGKSQLSVVSKQFVELFTQALSYRSRHEAATADVEAAEAAVIAAFLGVTLRLSLEDFKPLFQQFLNRLKLGGPASLLTMFNLIGQVAAALRHLFTFGVAFVLQEATRVLADHEGLGRGWIGLRAATLTCLTTVLTYSRAETTSTQQYEELVAALLSVYQRDRSLFPALEKCVVQLAAATEDDTNWKHLNFSVLMCLRDEKAEIRLAVLELIHKLVTDRSDTYLVVLPDAVPFLSEILEDDDSEVEKKCKELIQHMEATFGQNIESYFI